MGREIKFRIWDGTKFLDDFFGVTSDGQVVNLEDCFWNIDNHPDYIIEQFTGFKDINDKDIFEGDILKIIKPEREVGALIDYEILPREEELVEIQFSPTSGWFGKGFKNGQSFSHFNLTDYQNWEVIGNIHENPELLK